MIELDGKGSRCYGDQGEELQRALVMALLPLRVTHGGCKEALCDCSDSIGLLRGVRNGEKRQMRNANECAMYTEVKFNQI